MLRLVFAVLLLLSSIPAFAKPHHSAPQPQDSWSWLFGEQASLPPQPDHKASHSLGFSSDPYDLPQSAGNLLSVAQHYIGARNFTGSHRAWCGDAVNAWLKMTGHRPSGSGIAMSLLSVGPRVASPEPGDIIVMRRHVTVFAGYGGRGVLGVGGNQGRGRVTTSSYPIRSVVAFVRPS